MKSKLEQILFAGLAVTMLFTACKKTETLSSVAGSKNAVTFSASISSAGTGTTAAVSKIKTSAVTPSQTVPRAVNNTWEANDAIGVYMKQGNGLSQIVSGNKKYTTTGNGSFTAASTADAITFPVNGAPVDFISYYPYKSSLTNNIYPVDVSNQSSQGAIDLMYSNNAVNLDKTTPKASLVFTHQLSKLVFVVKNGGGVPNLTGLSASIDGLNTGGDFDLATGTLKVNGKTAAIAAKITPEATDVLVEAIVPPAASITGATVTFTLPSGKFTWTVPANAVYEKGKKYTYQIELRNTAAIPVPVTLSATITDWVDVPSGSSVVEPYNINQDASLAQYMCWWSGFNGLQMPLKDMPDGVNTVHLFLIDLDIRPKVALDTTHISMQPGMTWTRTLNDAHALQARGIKVVVTIMGLYNQTTDTIAPYTKSHGIPPTVMNKGIAFGSITDPKTYAATIKKKVLDDWKLDGIDLDIEEIWDGRGGPSAYNNTVDKNGNYIFETPQSTSNASNLINELAKYFGPKSKSGKLFIVDRGANPGDLIPKVYTCFDRIIFQLYGDGPSSVTDAYDQNKKYFGAENMYFTYYAHRQVSDYDEDASPLLSAFNFGSTVDGAVKMFSAFSSVVLPGQKRTINTGLYQMSGDWSLKYPLTNAAFTVQKKPLAKGGM